ncbi:MAG: DUF2306 domain-containing protein [Pseudomonadota bacterium]
MSLDPLLEASLAIRIHAFAALTALGIGVVQLLGVKGTTMHRGLGYVWVLAMATVAVSSFWIHEIDQLAGFSLIHVLSVYVLVTLPPAVMAARAGQVVRHRYMMRGMFFFGLLLAGAFTLLPGRMMYQIVFGG